MLELFSWPSEALDRFHLFLARRHDPIAMRDFAKPSQNSKTGDLARAALHAKSDTEQSAVQRVCSDAGPGRRSRARTEPLENSDAQQTHSLRADFAGSGHPFNVRVLRREQRQMLLLG